ncbi:MAG: YigZ family protein [Bacteroidales bacterium]|nr:YigZ family protein [Bacteroidales bacterium]
MEADQYKTIEAPSEGIYKEKGSRFLAFAFPVYSQEEIKALIEQYEKKYHDARHCCYAWKLGMTDDLYRQNDDGEPSGTAGKPIYGQILSNELTNILVIVVRYFGGIKLGTGGLIVAYKTATADAFSNANIVEQYIMDTYDISFSYDNMNDVMKCVKDSALEVISQSFDLNCSIRFKTRHSKINDVISRLENIDGVSSEFISSI